MKGLVYRHRRLDTNEVFYVGFASRIQRAHTKHGRNKEWNAISSEYGHSVEIIASELSKDEALELEMFLIEEYGGSLCNITIGGEVGSLGYKHTSEALSKISKASVKTNSGVPKSREHRQKISNSTIGIPRPYVSDLHSKKISQYSKDGSFVRDWDSAEEAGRELGINAPNICSCRNGNRQTAGGYIWK